MELTLGFSPCPNDTFIFDALVNRKIDTKGFTFNAALEDVETLNQWALQGKLDVTKLSFGVYFKVMEHYELLNAGSALGRGCGPLLISKGPLDMDKMADYKIAIPGLNTTANLLFSTAFPMHKTRS
ncbi:MqnA/MqnD/SBP family protein [Chitinophaga sedimenti]|uniref:MqnA/MqnD/SBP family protein n=1 Tax=Chitinophaga sedimenti TaxID=2033606 RepID=UPI00249E14A7|nr:MqnA/MqnD/SBP family protein [Chitinophaga sedimenti]